MNLKIRKMMLERISYHIDDLADAKLTEGDIEAMSDEDLRDLAITLSINLD